jgi:RNA polymerase sigma-70 factor (ECF subfamily)
MERSYSASGLHPWKNGEEQLPDAALIERIVRREEYALGILYDRYARLVYAIALRISGEHSIAEEVTQDVFHAIWQSAASFQSDGNLSHWIMGIARHRAIDATRTRRYRSQQREIGLTNDQPDIASTNDEPTDQLLLRQVIQNALTSLPNSQSRALTLAFYGGLTHLEIASELDQPIGTIKSRMRLGMLKLRSILDFLQE